MQQPSAPHNNQSSNNHEAYMDDNDIREGCPSDSSEAGSAPGCEGCPGRALCLSQAGPDPGMIQSKEGGPAAQLLITIVQLFTLALNTHVLNELFFFYETCVLR